jgi:hypothetical protein
MLQGAFCVEKAAFEKRIFHDKGTIKAQGFA